MDSGPPVSPELQAPESAPPARPYAPSWLDGLIRAVERLPLPNPLVYLGVFAAGHLVIAYVRARDGSSLGSAIFQAPRIFWLWMAYLPALTHLLNRVARTQLRRFRPALEADDRTMADLEYRLTTMPALPPVLLGLVWMAIGAAILRQNAPVVARLGFPGWEVAATVMSYFVGGAAIYHSVHQLRMVSRIYGLVKRLDLHHLEPVYALSRLTALTAIGWIVLLAVTEPLVPGELAKSSAIEATWVFLIGLAAASFILPLWGMHERLENSKARLLARLSADMAELRETVHGRIRDGELDGIDPLNKALVILATEREAIAKVPTWPWQPATLRSFLSALLLPIILRLAQGAMGRMLGLGGP